MTDDAERVIARYRRAAMLLTIVVVGCLYLAASLTYGRTLRSTSQPSGAQALLGDALLDGNAAVFPTPPGLTDLADPYDPVQNGAFRAAGIHDLALYDGHLYTTSGATTAVLFHVPSRVLGLGNMNPNLVTLLASFAGFVALAAIFGEARRRSFATLPLWAEIVSVLALGLASPAFWLVSIGRSYESAIAVGLMCIAAGAYFLLRGVRDAARPNRWFLGAGALALALAVGARPHFASAVLLVVAAGVVVVRAAPDRRDLTLSVLAIAAPYVLVGVLIGAFNVVRFGTVTEFGTSYQLAGMNMRAYEGYQLSYIAPSVVDYIFSWPRFESTWPYVHLRRSTFANNPDVHSYEPIAGVLWLYPYIVIGFAVTIARARSLWRDARALAWVMLLGLALGLATLLAVSFPFNASTMRYSADFTPILALVAALGWAWSYARATPASAARRVLAGVWIAGTALSIAAGVALVVTPCPGTGSC